MTIFTWKSRSFSPVIFLLFFLSDTSLNINWAYTIQKKDKISQLSLHLVCLSGNGMYSFWVVPLEGTVLLLLAFLLNSAICKANVIVDAGIITIEQQVGMILMIFKLIYTTSGFLIFRIFSSWERDKIPSCLNYYCYRSSVRYRWK